MMMNRLLCPLTRAVSHGATQVSTRLAWYARRPIRDMRGSKPSSVARRRAERESARSNRCADPRFKDTAAAQIKWKNGMKADAARNAKTREGTACEQELMDRDFKRLGRATQTLAGALEHRLVLDGAAGVSVNDLLVSQPRNIQPLIDFREQHVPAAERDSFKLRDAVDRLPFTFNQEDPDAPAIGITVKASTCVKGSGDEEYISVYLGGTCHDHTEGAEDRVRCILDDRDGALAGLLDSPLPGGHGTHADTMLLYAVSTEPGIPVAVLSRVPLQQLADLVPDEWLTQTHLKLPVDPAHPAWTLLDKAFMRVEWTPGVEMPSADSVIKAVHAIIQPDPHTLGLLHGPFLFTDQGLAATLHFRAHDDTHGLGAKGEFYIRQAGLMAGVVTKQEWVHKVGRLHPSHPSAWPRWSDAACPPSAFLVQFKARGAKANGHCINFSVSWFDGQEDIARLYNRQQVDIVCMLGGHDSELGVVDASFRHALVFDSLTLCAGGLMADGKRFEAGSGGIVLPLSAAYRPASTDTRIAPRALAIDLTSADSPQQLGATISETLQALVARQCPKAVNWAGIVSRARTALVPKGLLDGAGLDLSDWYDDNCPGEMQDAADEAVRKLTEPGGGTLGGGVSAWISAALRIRAPPLKLTAAWQKALVWGHPCSKCRHLKAKIRFKTPASKICMSCRSACGKRSKAK